MRSAASFNRSISRPPTRPCETWIKYIFTSNVRRGNTTQESSEHQNPAICAFPCWYVPIYLGKKKKINVCLFFRFSKKCSTFESTPCFLYFGRRVSCRNMVDKRKSAWWRYFLPQHPKGYQILAPSRQLKAIRKRSLYEINTFSIQILERVKRTNRSHLRNAIHNIQGD